MKGACKHWYNRSFQDLEAHFGFGVIKKTIEEKLRFQDEVNLLEIGYGSGRALLELRKMFPTKRLRLSGINYDSNSKEPELFKSRMVLRDTGLNNGIFTPEEFEKIWLPQTYFYDVGEGLRFNRTIDVIISQFTFPYVKRKDKLVEDMWRVLNPRGVAFVHMGVKHEKYPSLLQISETPRFVISQRLDTIIPLSEYFVKQKIKALILL